MVGFNRLRRAAVAPLLGLWLGCVLMTWNATGINNCSIQALAGLGCTNRTYYTFRISKVDCKNIFNTWNIVFLISWKAVDECRPGSSLLLGGNPAVDLAYLLQKHSVSFSHYTVWFKFMKEQLPTDLVQLDVLFQKARGEGINIQCWKFLLILLGNYFSIALVNQYKLSHSWLEDVILPGLAGGNSGFAGEGDPFCPLSSLSIRSYKNGL
ncbi:hypothetical protein POTOM_036658 [Populus tomentosa]|uniref:Uncharacterized protein n=1 Tax=Populus tomentosa TaxID=118781 RepID=A0A8X7Z3B3_POPTO|nr:hypothetical protein POTOM_036658 [Populus tomentosa]